MGRCTRDRVYFQSDTLYNPPVPTAQNVYFPPTLRIARQDARNQYEKVRGLKTEMLANPDTVRCSNHCAFSR
mgnify:CR=1 FL=1